MTIGIIGAGSIGAAFARRAAQANIPAILSNSRGPDSLSALVGEIGGLVRPGTRQEAAAQEVVLVAVNWEKLHAALGDLPDFGGRVVIDANNPIIGPKYEIAELHGRMSNDAFADFVRGARIVKAFNHFSAKILADEPRVAGGRRVLFFAGSDVSAKAEVAALIEKLGFFGIDLGSVNEGGRAINIPVGALTGQNLIRLD
jgi:8-hydroxy-5-deazaflavin:NADPH oxidoreductase